MIQDEHGRHIIDSRELCPDSVDSRFFECATQMLTKTEEIVGFRAVMMALGQWEELVAKRLDQCGGVICAHFVGGVWDGREMPVPCSAPGVVPQRILPYGIDDDEAKAVGAYVFDGEVQGKGEFCRRYVAEGTSL